MKNIRLNQYKKTIKGHRDIFKSEQFSQTTSRNLHLELPKKGLQTPKGQGRRVFSRYVFGVSEWQMILYFGVPDPKKCLRWHQNLMVTRRQETHPGCGIHPCYEKPKFTAPRPSRATETEVRYDWTPKTHLSNTIQLKRYDWKTCRAGAEVRHNFTDLREFVPGMLFRHPTKPQSFSDFSVSPQVVVDFFFAEKVSSL